MMSIVKVDVYMHRYDGYIAYLHEFEDGTQMMEYVLELPDREPCHIKHRVRGKLDKAYTYICSLEDYDEKTKRPKKLKRSYGH